LTANPLTEATQVVKHQNFCWKAWFLWKMIDETQVGNMSLIFKSYQALWTFLKNLSWTNLSFGKKSCFHGVFHKFCHLKFLTFYNVFFWGPKTITKTSLIAALPNLIVKIMEGTGICFYEFCWFLTWFSCLIHLAARMYYLMRKKFWDRSFFGWKIKNQRICCRSFFFLLNILSSEFATKNTRFSWPKHGFFLRKFSFFFFVESSLLFSLSIIRHVFHNI
jgi:hypothetical protein